jgi:hypothetical protein
MGRAFSFGAAAVRVHPARSGCVGRVGMLRLRDEYRLAMLIPPLSMTTDGAWVGAGCGVRGMGDPLRQAQGRLSSRWRKRGASG